MEGRLDRPRCGCPSGGGQLAFLLRTAVGRRAGGRVRRVGCPGRRRRPPSCCAPAAGRLRRSERHRCRPETRHPEAPGTAVARNSRPSRRVCRFPNRRAAERLQAGGLPRSRYTAKRWPRCVEKSPPQSPRPRHRRPSPLRVHANGTWRSTPLRLGPCSCRARSRRLSPSAQRGDPLLRRYAFQQDAGLGAKRGHTALPSGDGELRDVDRSKGHVSSPPPASMPVPRSGPPRGRVPSCRGQGRSPAVRSRQCVEPTRAHPAL